MTNYDHFAKFYDAIMGDRSDVIELLQKSLKKHHPAAKTLLELGCGTGSILDGLKTQYQIAGIEKSPEMLKIAQRKLPNSRLEIGDIARYELGTTFDVIICVFDTINHLTNFAKWETMFDATAKHLAPGGIFIFDMISIERLHKLMAMPTYTQDIGSLIADMEIERVSDNEVEWTTTIQEPHPDGTIQVYEDHASEASFQLNEVIKAVSRRFELINTFDSFHRPATDASDRVYFVARAQ
ncbi:class I SAM-dependent methyltransferase [Candidatus Saccharibacteria bacterium]|nr:class I SAM-dependent methyltransferase [Candidatus Saccharibacteria bacterium]